MGLQVLEGGEAVRLRCKNEGDLIAAVSFASWGRPGGRCSASLGHTFAEQDACHAADSASIAKELCVGKYECTLKPDNEQWGGDPCYGKGKWMGVAVTCSAGAIDDIHQEL